MQLPTLWFTFSFAEPFNFAEVAKNAKIKMLKMQLLTKIKHTKKSAKNESCIFSPLP